MVTKHVSAISRLRVFTNRSTFIRYSNTFMKPQLKFDRLVFEDTLKRRPDSSRFKVSYCKRSRPGLSQLDCEHDRQRIPLQDGDRSGNDPRLVPGFLRRRSGMFPERFRRMSVSMGSREIHLIWTVHPRCGTLSC